MKSQWNETAASRLHGELAQRVYTSRLLGRDPSLVLHGGGNTSVKLRERNLFGDDEEILYVKGRGADLATIDVKGFSPCRLEPLLRLAELESLTDAQMERELRVSMIRPGAPAPSVETLLHAILPAKFVDHTHADALIAVMNSEGGAERVREIYGSDVVVVPYVMPGFKLVRACRELYARHATSKTIGLILLHHGIFTFGDSAWSSYERMIELVDRAERYLQRHKAWEIRRESSASPQPTDGSAACSWRNEIATLRREVSSVAGVPMILASHRDEQAIRFVQRADVAELSQRGGLTPDHVIRTKRVPLVGRDVQAYRREYHAYVAQHAGSRPLAAVDPAPRVILDTELGLCTVGRTATDAAICEDIYRHTIDTMLRAEKLGGWRALPSRDFFDVEYWDMERAKLDKGAACAELAGEIVVVTGAASGIGKACVDAFLAQGAAVIALDIAPAVRGLHERPDYLGLTCDLTNESQIAESLEQGVRAFGGVDMLVLNAGIFPGSAPIASLSTSLWRRVMNINLDSNLVLLRECHPLLKCAPRGGRVVLIGSKNVVAPGPGAAAYSASKAALQQLARVAALEWGEDGIRVNTLHPNAVFDTAIWTPDVLAARAASYGLSVEEYKTNNILKVEVTSRDVAELAVDLCGPTFSRTTGAQIPVDGGNVRII